MSFINDTLLHNRDNTIALVTHSQIKPGRKIGVSLEYLQTVLDYIKMMSCDSGVVQLSLVMSCDDGGPLLGIRTPDGASWFVIAPIAGHTDDLKGA